MKRKTVDTVKKGALINNKDTHENSKISQKQSMSKKCINIIKTLCILAMFIVMLTIINERAEAAPKYAKSSDGIKVTIKGTDLNYASNSLSKEQITVKVGATVVTPTIEISTATNITNGIQYVVTLVNIPTNVNGDLTLQIGANTLVDTAQNKNIQTTIQTGITIDNEAPTNTSYEITNESGQGYDVYVYGVADTSSGIKEVKFEIWDEYDGDKITVVGENKGNGTWYINFSHDHMGIYPTNIVINDNAGNTKTIEATAEIHGIEIAETIASHNYIAAMTAVINPSKVSKYYMSKDNGTSWVVPTQMVFPTQVVFPDGSDEVMSKNGTYYFDKSGETIIPNNTGIHNSVANSYIELDMTGISKFLPIILKLNAQIESESSSDYGYATITETTTAPAYNVEAGRFMYVSGVKMATDYMTMLTGGKKYYLHLGYRKDGSGNIGADRLTINHMFVGVLGHMIEGLESETEYNIKAKAILTNGYEIVSETVKRKTDKFSPQVGDYINYTPDATDTSYELTAVNSGYTSNQTIAKDTTLKWRILNINEDGSMDLVSTNPTAGIAYFKGATGYNNGVYLMNEICEKLYSNSTLGVKARSINLEDIERQMTPEGKAARDAYTIDGVQYNKTKQYTRFSSYYPNIYAKENGSGINTVVTKTDGIGFSDKGTLDISTPGYGQATTSGLTVTQKYYSGAFTTLCNSKAAEMLESSNNYWVASRFVGCSVSVAGFGLLNADSTIYGYGMFYSGSITSYGNRRLRPVVSLGSNIKINGSNGENSESNPHIIGN